MKRRNQAAAREFIEKYADGGGEIRFFSSLNLWRRAVKARHPKAEIQRAGDVRRAYVGKVKVAVFGNLPGHGYVVGYHMGAQLHRRRQRCP